MFQLLCFSCCVSVAVFQLLLKQEAVLKATAVRSPFAGNVIDSSLSSLSSPWGGGSDGGGGLVGGRGSSGGKGLEERVGGRVGGRGHFIHPAIHCTTTWCFALKGLRTITGSSMELFSFGRVSVSHTMSHFMMFSTWLMFCKLVSNLIMFRHATFKCELSL